MVVTEKLRQPYFQYLLAVTLVGLAIVATGIVQVRESENLWIFFLLLALAAISEIAATTVPKDALTFEVGTAVSMAAIPTFGPTGAAIISAVSSIAIWILHPQQQQGWKRSWEQLSFNAGMHSIAIFVASHALLRLYGWLGGDNLIEVILPWLVAAVIYDQLNFWILMAIVRLKEGSELDVWAIWRQTKWAMMINITVLAVGGSILAFAVGRFDWIGIAIFFLPIALSAYAFRVYVRQMQAHMNNLEAIVEERTQELAQLMKEKDAFLAVLTHDMKSPLASIRLSSDVLANYPQAVDKRPHLLRAIINSERALTDIVNNILDLEKLRAGGELPLERQNLDLVNLMSETVQIIDVEAQQKDINLSFETNREQMYVMGDSEQLRRALLNLLSNAVKYTPEHGRVAVEVHQNGEGAEIMVQDTGYGIPKEELPYIFDRYHRVPGHVKLAAGTGLGLAIARAVVQAHGGEIMVESEEGKGSLFKVKLPLIS